MLSNRYNKAPEEDGVAIEAIKLEGTLLISKSPTLFNLHLQSENMPNK